MTGMVDQIIRRQSGVWIAGIDTSRRIDSHGTQVRVFIGPCTIGLVN